MKRRENSFLSRIKQLDFGLLAAVIILTGYGIACISSASEYSGNTRNVIVQLIAALLGLIAMAVIALIDYDELLKKLWLVIFFVGLALLFLPIMKNVPSMLRGNFGLNESWIKIPVLNVFLQPAEVVKVTFIMSFGYLLGHLKQSINSIKSLLLIALFGGVTVAFVLLERDLGMAIVFIVIIIVMCFTARLSVWYFIGAAAAFVAASPFLWNMLGDYQKKRILVGFDPTLDPEDTGYQVLQTMKAISNGGIWGMGYGKGSLTHSAYKSTFPARETDVILGVMGEEFGFVGIIVYLLLISYVVFKILKTARESRKEYGCYICAAVAALILFQTIENVGMCLGLLPVIGLTLPFISYGGSSIVSMYLCIGVVMSIRTHKEKYYIERESR